MNYVVALPAKFNITSMYGFVGMLIGPDKQPLHHDVVFDFLHLEAIDGGGLTVFSNTLEWLQKRGVRYHFANHTMDGDAVRYLDDCGFFKTYLGKALFQLSAVRNTTLPVTKISHSESFAWLEFEAIPWLSNKLSITPFSLTNIKVCIKEIFNNIADHSSEDIGCIHIQWYPNKYQIHITISDFGIGIPSAISNCYGVQNDGEAVILAIEEGITTKSVKGNSGAGLSVLVDYVVIANQGNVSIYSGCGGVNCSPRFGRVRKVPWVGKG